MKRLDLLEEDGRRSLRGIPISRLADKTVLITGASGIIGTHFLFGLLHCQGQLGLRLKVVAVVQRGVPDHLKQLEQQGYARFLIGNMARPVLMKSSAVQSLVPTVMTLLADWFERGEFKDALLEAV